VKFADPTLMVGFSSADAPAEAPVVADGDVVPPPVVQALMSSASNDAPRATVRRVRIGSSM
jgi:hypothetical protein